MGSLLAIVNNHIGKEESLSLNNNVGKQTSERLEDSKTLKKFVQDDLVHTLDNIRRPSISEEIVNSNRNDPPMRHTSTTNTQPAIIKSTSPKILKPMAVGKTGSRSPESQARINNEARTVLDELINTTHTVTPRVTTLAREVSQELPTTFVTPSSEKVPLDVDYKRYTMKQLRRKKTQKILTL